MFFRTLALYTKLSFHKTDYKGVVMNILKKSLKILGIVLASVVIIVIALISYASLQWDKRVDRPVRELTASRDSASIARGEFLFKTSLTCWTCHGGEDANSPPSGGMKFDLTILSPSLGVYYARNITPDPETGIGSWTDGEVVRAIREGIRKDGTVLFPIMPVDPLNELSDEDVLAVVAYLRSIPPVRNEVAQREPSLFAKTLMTFGAIGPAKQQTDPVVAPPRELTPPYGAYVAKHASLCSDCHTPRNLMDGSFYYDSLLAGSSIKFGDGEPVPVASFAPNITPDSTTGIGRWTEEEFLRMLRTGVGPDGRVRTRHMPYAYYGLWDSLELRAVYAFIRSIPPVRRTVPPSTFVGDMLSNDSGIRGKGIFESYCITCHGDKGKGAPPTNVKLAEVAPSLADADLKELITQGIPNLRMPAFANTLKHDEIEAVMTYIRSWGEHSE